MRQPVLQLLRELLLGVAAGAATAVRTDGASMAESIVLIIILLVVACTGVASWIGKGDALIYQR